MKVLKVVASALAAFAVIGNLMVPAEAVTCSPFWVYVTEGFVWPGTYSTAALCEANAALAVHSGYGSPPPYSCIAIPTYPTSCGPAANISVIGGGAPLQSTDPSTSR